MYHLFGNEFVNLHLKDINSVQVEFCGFLKYHKCVVSAKKKKDIIASNIMAGILLGIILF